MGEARSAAVWRDIQILFETGTASGLTDRQLLERVALGRRDATGEAALEVVVLRHGPMVMQVCRNLLRDEHDAEDAFQATFLVLARRMNSVRQMESVGGWLCGVASRVASRVRVEGARRRLMEGRAAARVAEVVGDVEVGRVLDDEVGRLVQEEVSRLPGNYRDVVVLCFMQGLTQEQAAARLGRPVGTVRSRMARGKELLRKRLARRGVGPTAIGGGGISGLGAVSPELVAVTVPAAMAVAGGMRLGSVASGVVASLVNQTLWSLTMIKVGGLAAGVLAVGLSGIGVVMVQGRGLTPVEGAGSGQAAARPTEQVGEKSGERTKDCPPADLANPDFRPRREGLYEQRKATLRAEVDFNNARLARQIAELNLEQYSEQTFVKDLALANGEVTLAVSDLKRAEDRFDWAARMFDKGYISQAQKASEELALRKAISQVQIAQGRKDTLVKSSKGKNTQSLQGEVEKARADEASKQRVWEGAKTKLAEIERLDAK